MSNPFPGVNPYIEAEGHWEDFHGRFINALSEALLARLPGGYDATINERQFLDTGPLEIRIPDVSIERLTPPPARPPAAVESEGNGGVAVVEAPPTAATIQPVLTRVPGIQEVRELWVEIRRLVDRSLVTAIELLSPTNKRGRGRRLYERKRDRMMSRGAHLVEIDLLVKGKRPKFVPPPPPRDCYAFVVRADRLPEALAYGWDLRDRIPALPIPLRAPDPDVWIDLGAVYADTFRRGGYPRRLRYAGPIESLPQEVAVWAQRVARPDPGGGTGA